ncbi:MAG TPA: cytochrome P450 [Acidimicrobiales bacterium]|jgi:cytochrome P450|nr:cytochrome P450 [Acidimicrobiales bacterium]
MSNERQPKVEFDHHAPDFPAVAAYRELRQRCPVAWTDTYGGFWILSRYEDIARAARDDETFSSGRTPDGRGGIVIPQWNSETSIPIELDPPQSVPYRRMLNYLLSPAAVEAMKPRIAEYTTAMIDAFIERGECDFINELTSPVPALLTVNWLGFPAEYYARFAQAVHDVFGSAPGTERERRGIEGMDWIMQETKALVDARRREPRDDVVSYLCAQEIDGRPLSDEEILSMVKLLIGGGMDTTTSLTGQTLVWLSEHPEARQRLIDEPELLPSATEEFLRVFAPSQSMARTVRRPVEVGGCPMHVGDRVLLPWVAANFDETVFENPDEVQLDRPKNRHASFGIGIHRCVGSHLARAMFQEMITQVLARLPDYRVLTDRLVAYPSHGNQTGWDVVPAVFTPGRRTRAPSAA